MRNPGKERMTSGFGRHLHVFLFALYPILLLYQQNLGEAAWARTIHPILVALALALLLWLGLGFLLADRDKRAVAAIVILLAAWYYKLILDLLAAALEPLLPGSVPLFAHALLVASVAAALFFIRRSSRSFTNASRILRAITFILVAWSLGAIILHHARGIGGRQDRQPLRTNEFTPLPSAAAKPDIYCIFLDEFASLESVRTLFGLDQSRFAARLRGSGFFIAEKSRGLHLETPAAIASVLNMENVPARGNATSLVQRNKVARFLKENGYAIYDFPYLDLAAQDLAQEHVALPLTDRSIFFDDFTKALFDMSVLYALSRNWQMDEGQYLSYVRHQVLYVFEQLPAIARRPGPKFVLVHLYSPHVPFVFNRDGGAVPPEHSLDYSQRKYYLEQYLYISRRAAGMAEAILRESSTPPIILLMSDHGYRGSFRKPLLHVVPLAEKRKVFLAMHLPGYPASQLDPALAPVNVFRMIFNHYFGQNLPLQSNPE